MSLMSSFPTNRIIRLKFEPVVLEQFLFNLWKNIWTGYFEELANAFENLRNLFIRENFVFDSADCVHRLS